LGRTRGTAAGNLHIRGTTPRSVFISYTTHADADLAARERLRKILGLICHARTVRGDPWSVWVDDGRLKAGDRWKDHLIDALNDASLFVIVMSTDYMASEFCRDQELPRMLERHDEEDVRVLGVWLDDVNLDLCVAPLAGGRVMSMQDLQCLPRGPKGDGLLAVRQWDDEDDAWSKVAEEIERAWPTTDDVPSKVEPDGDGSSELKLPYWCDRYTQVKSLSRCLRQSVAPRRPLVLVHEAHEDDVPAEWVQRLALSEIDKAMLSAKGREAPGFGTPHYFG
jgi:TIR domain